MANRSKAYLMKELTRTIDESDSTAAFCLCQRWILKEALALLKESEVRELTIDEWREWKANPKRDPICMIYKQDDTHTPIWVLDPNKVHEPALLMGEIKLFTGKPTFEQRKAVKWK